MIKIEPNSKLNPENGVNFEVNNQEIKEEDVDYSKLSELGKLVQIAIFICLN